MFQETRGRYFFSSTRWLRPIVHIDLYKDEVKKIWNPQKKNLDKNDDFVYSIPWICCRFFFRNKKTEIIDVHTFFIVYILLYNSILNWFSLTLQSLNIIDFFSDVEHFFPGIAPNVCCWKKITGWIVLQYKIIVTKYLNIAI
jgi:hypothetical protein